MNADELKTVLEQHKLWLFDNGGERADLRWADLDYSCLPLWCGSQGMTVDKRIAAQIAAHFCALDCDDADYLAARAAILEFAKTSHRASYLGLLEEAE